MFFVYFSVRSYNSNNKCSFSFLFIFYNRYKLQNHIMANARIWNARRFICFFFSLRLTWYRKYIGTRIPFVLKYISEFYLNFIWNMKSQPILLFFVFRFNARKKKTEELLMNSNVRRILHNRKSMDFWAFYNQISKDESNRHSTSFWIFKEFHWKSMVFKWMNLRWK